MIRSMTGYGKAVASVGRKKVTIEITSLNNRFLEISLRLPKNFAEYEGLIREAITDMVSRGKLNVFLTYDDKDVNAETIVLNEDVAKLYFKMFNDLKSRFKLAGQISVADFVGLPDLFSVTTADPLNDNDVKKLIAAVRRAVRSLNRTRQTEGKALSADMLKRVNKITQSVARIKKLRGRSLKRYRDRLNDVVGRLRESGAAIGDNDETRLRLNMELGILAEKADITEECVRLVSHCEAFKAAVRAKGDSGKRLNFTLQEMNREANTIGSKSAIYEISAEVIKIREEIEKLREQVQNIE